MADEEAQNVEVIELNEDDCSEEEKEVDVDEQAAGEALPDDADYVFNKHTGSVFSCDLNPENGDIAVSGGEDDCAYLWNMSTEEVLFKSYGHSDSVISVCFNHNGMFFATGDMGGIVQVWRVDESNYRVASYETTDLAWLRWHPSSNVLLAGTIEGNVSMWLLGRDGCKILPGHRSMTDCCKILPDGVKLAVGYGDGSIYIWDMKSLSAIHKIINENAHTASVTVIDCSDNLLLSGSVDGSAKLINFNTGKVLGTLGTPSKVDKFEKRQYSVECVAFCKTLPICATGSLDGHLRIFDIATQVQTHAIDNKSGVIRLLWSPIESHMVYTAALDGVLRSWDVRSGTKVSQWSGHTAEILDMVISKCGNTILTAADDKTCRVFRINKPDR